MHGSNCRLSFRNIVKIHAARDQFSTDRSGYYLDGIAYRSHFRGGVRLDAEPGADGVVVEGVFGKELFCVRRGKERIVAVRETIDGNVLAGKRLVIQVGPACCDALVGITVKERCRPCGRVLFLTVLQAECLFGTLCGWVAVRVEKLKLIEVDEMVVTVT